VNADEALDGTSRRSQGIDLLRAVAALAVVFWHSGLLTASAGAPRTGVAAFVGINGGKGVLLFFAVSGYLISRPFVRAGFGLSVAPSLRNYGRRRLARIWPAHALALTAMVFLILADTYAYPHDFTPGRYAAHLLFVQNFIPGVSGTILPVTWTLGIEATFYLLVPCVFWTFVKRRGGLRSIGWFLVFLTAAWIGGAIILAANVPELPATPGSVILDNILSPALGYLVYFAPGILVAAVEAHGTATGSHGMARIGRAAPLLLAGSAAMWVVTGLVLPASLVGVPGDGSPVALIVTALLDSSFCGMAVLAMVSIGPRLKASRVLVAVGESSYGMYLWHWIVINGIFWFAVRLNLPVGVLSNPLMDFFLVAGLTFPVAWLSWRLIELPCMRWARRRETLRPVGGLIQAEAQ
jgi:acetyltransferase